MLALDRKRDDMTQINDMPNRTEAKREWVAPEIYQADIKATAGSPSPGWLESTSPPGNPS